MCHIRSVNCRLSIEVDLVLVGQSAYGSAHSATHQRPACDAAADYGSAECTHASTNRAAA
jgi:hypothetical protein